MAFEPVCKQRHLGEGEMFPGSAGGREILIVWADGGEAKAFDGLCPHGDFPMARGQFNGRLLVCPSHDWVFDARSGKGLSPTGCALKQYALRVEDGMVLVDTDTVLTE